MPIYRRHLGLVVNRRGGFHHWKVSRYPNLDSTFQLTRLAVSGDIKLNPGPSTLGSSTKKLSCQTRSRMIGCNHHMLTCNLSGFKYHIKCGNVTPKKYKEIISSDPKTWNCEGCSTQQLKCSSLDLDLTLLHQFPFDGQLVYSHDVLWREPALFV